MMQRGGWGWWGQLGAGGGRGEGTAEAGERERRRRGGDGMHEGRVPGRRNAVEPGLRGLAGPGPEAAGGAARAGGRWA